MYAIWRYDLYPFILTGEVRGSPDDEGWVRIKGMSGYKFMPLKLVSNKRGKQLDGLIKEARLRFDEARKKVSLEIAEELGIAELMKEAMR